MIDDDELYGLYCDIGRLEAENAKLRWLTRDWRIGLMGTDSTRQGRRSDALYYDSAMSRRVLCDMVARLEQEIERMRDGICEAIRSKPEVGEDQQGNEAG